MLAPELEERLSRIEDLLAFSDLHEYATGEFIGWVQRFFVVAGPVLHLGRIEETLQASLARDFATLRLHLERLAQITEADLTDDVAPEECSALAARIEEARTLVATTERQMPQISTMEIAFRLEVFIDRAISQGLRLIRRPSAFVDELVSAVEHKLDLLADDQRRMMWARVTREIIAGNETDPEIDEDDLRLPMSADILRPSFLDVPDESVLPRRTAEYLVDLRPQLVRAANRLAQRSLPMSPVAIAQVLSWTADTDVPSADEERAATAASRVLFVMKKRLGRDWDGVLRASGLRPDGRIASGPRFDDADDIVPNAPEFALRVGVNECRALLAFARNRFQGAREPELEMLIRYKLSLEADPNTARAALAGLNEVALQRRTASFLAEHGMFVRGTKTGRSETDLVHGHDPDAFIIEVKLFQEAFALSDVPDAISQLQSYMDQRPFNSRGAVLIFNFSSIPVRAPKEYLRGRLGVIVINLPADPPSATDDVIVIDHSKHAEHIVDVYRTKSRSNRRIRSAPP